MEHGPWRNWWLLMVAPGRSSGPWCFLLAASCGRLERLQVRGELLRVGARWGCAHSIAGALGKACAGVQPGLVGLLRDFRQGLTSFPAEPPSALGGRTFFHLLCRGSLAGAHGSFSWAVRWGGAGWRWRLGSALWARRAAQGSPEQLPGGDLCGQWTPCGMWPLSLSCERRISKWFAERFATLGSGSAELVQTG